MKHTTNNSRNETVLLSAVFIIPLLMVWMVFISNSSWLDDKVFAFTGPLVSAGLTSFMKAVTFLGTHDFLIPANLVLIIILLIKKKKQLAWYTLVVALSSLGLMSLLKNLFQRKRPDHPMVEGVTNYSFPSGHAFMSVAFFGLLIWLVLEYTNNRYIKVLLLFFLSLLILLIGFSRIYLRLHYASDVIAGFGIGTLWLYTCLYLLNRYSPVKERVRL